MKNQLRLEILAMPSFWTPRKTRSKTVLRRINPYLLEERTPKAKAVWEKVFKLTKQTWSSPVWVCWDSHMFLFCIDGHIHKHPPGPETVPLQQRKHILQQQNNLLGRAVDDSSMLRMFLALPAWLRLRRHKHARRQHGVSPCCMWMWCFFVDSCISLTSSNTTVVSLIFLQ